MKPIIEIIDKTGRKIYLSDERHKHLLKHPHMHEQLDDIKLTIKEANNNKIQRRRRDCSLLL